MNPGDQEVANLAVLAQDADPIVRRKVASRADATVEILVLLAQDSDEYVRRSVAEHSQTPIDVLKDLAQDASTSVRYAVAGNPHTPESTLLELAQTDRDSFDGAFSGNPSTPPDVLADIATSALRGGEMPFITWNLLRNPGTPVDFLLHFSTGPADLRAMVAGNPSTPIDVLTALSKDKAKTVREAVAANPNVNDELKAAATATNARVRAKNPSVADRVKHVYEGELDEKTLEDLLADKAMGVRLAAAIRGREIGLISTEECVRLLERETQNNGARQTFERWTATRSEVLLEVMIVGRFEDQLTSIARDPTTPIEVVRRLFNANIPGVAWFFATREGVTADELDALSTAPSNSYPMWSEPESLRPGEIYNDGFVTCYPQVIVALHPLTRPETLTKMRKARSKYVRAALAQRPDLEALPGLAKDKESSVRVAVATQTATPAAILEALALDPDREVRAAVHANPNSSETARAAGALLGT